MSRKTANILTRLSIRQNKVAPTTHNGVGAETVGLRQNSLNIENDCPTKISMYAVTWNLAGKLPDAECLDTLLPEGYDIYGIASQECSQSIEQSFIYNSKQKWQGIIEQRLGSQYHLVATETLIAIHICIYAKSIIIPFIHKIRSESLPTGAGGILGNKGACAVSFILNGFSFLFVNAHFHAHSAKIKQRNEDYHTINCNLSLGKNSVITASDNLLINKQVTNKSGASSSSSSSNSLFDLPDTANLSNSKKKRMRRDSMVLGKAQTIKKDPEIRYDGLASDRFDFIFFMGDLNYRVNGNRKAVDSLIKNGMFDVLQNNDQLKVAREYKQVFQGFLEGDIDFPPTYKFDKNSDSYDTSEKARVQSWTDRILYRCNLQIISPKMAQHSTQLAIELKQPQQTIRQRSNMSTSDLEVEDKKMASSNRSVEDNDLSSSSADTHLHANVDSLQCPASEPTMTDNVASDITKRSFKQTTTSKLGEALDSNSATDLGFISLCQYKSIANLRISDHRPVFASFDIDFAPKNVIALKIFKQRIKLFEKEHAPMLVSRLNSMSVSRNSSSMSINVKTTQNGDILASPSMKNLGLNRDQSYHKARFSTHYYYRCFCLCFCFPCIRHCQCFRNCVKIQGRIRAMSEFETPR